MTDNKERKNNKGTSKGNSKDNNETSHINHITKSNKKYSKNSHDIKKHKQQ